tara:strand:- start:488 stop:847 length:360 start_codon:yes stop_codon:yes gene_type:complete
MTQKEAVHQMLVKHPHTRDSDSKLIANLWYNQLKKMGIDMNLLTAKGLLKLFADDKLGNPTSIRRDRAKFQELNVHLRGASYKKRQKNAQAKYKERIKNVGLYNKISADYEQEEIKFID